MDFKEDKLKLDGCTVTLKRGGKGPQLLYLHGASGAAAVAPFMQELAKDFDVLVPEHPGFGGSDEPAWLDNIHDLAYFYLGFFEKLQLEKTLVVGSSLGGWLALEIAVRSQQRIRGLSLIGPSGIYVPGLPRGDLFLWSPEERVRNLFVDQSIAERVLALPVDLDVALKNFHTVGKLAWEPRLHNPHLRKWLHRIKVPTQVIWGDSDRILPAGYAAEFGKLIPGARVDIVKNCGHLPQAEKPQEFLRLVREFAEGLPS